MQEFATPYDERKRLSRVHRKRYWSDPSYRLANINRSRLRQGLPPRQSVDEIAAVGPRVREGI